MAGWSCGSCGQPSPEGTRFCGHCGTPAAAAAAAAPPVQTWACRACGTANLPAMVFCGGCGAKSQPERAEEMRLVTALFADLSGFTTLADTLAVEDLHDVIRPLVAGLARIAEQYGGFIEKYAGDALLVVFGAPVTHEDDAQRALLAALEMHAALPRLVAQLGPNAAHLTIHIGVNTGRVIAGRIGSEGSSDYAVLGDSVILAQRLESACPPGETYVGASTYALTSDDFEMDVLEPLVLKGKLAPVQAYRLVGRRTQPLIPRALVGRNVELAAVEDGLAHAAVTTLVGEPGAGKSRLLAEVRRRGTARGETWLSARCLSYGASLAYWPLADLLRQELGVRPEDGPARVTAVLAEALPPRALPGARRLLGLESGGAPETARREVHDGVAGWLQSRGQVVLVVEDVHWADRSTLDVLAEVVRVGEVHVSLLMTAREEGRDAAARVAGDRPHRVVELGPLDHAGVAGVAETVLDGVAGRGLVALLVERAEGNALHALELTRSLSETDALVQTVEGWDLRPGWDVATVPTTIERVYATRLDTLTPPAAALLQLAAVVGRTVRTSLLRAVDDTGDVDAALPQLLTAGMLEPTTDSGEPAVTFSHALLQDVVYERLLRKRRRELHRRVADVARTLYGDGDETIGLLARHLYLADAGEEAVEPLLRAGRRAAGLYAHDEAAVHLEHAIEVLEKVGKEELLPVALLEIAHVDDLRGRYDAAIASYEKARALGAGARAAVGAVAVLSKTGRTSEALDLADEQLTHHAHGPEAVALWLARARVAHAAGRPVDALAAIRAGLRLTEPEGGMTRAELLVELVRSEVEVGYPEFAVAHGRKALELLEAGGDQAALAEALRLIGDAHRKLAQLDEAARRLEQAIHLTQQMGLLEETAATLVNLGVVYRDLGDVVTALDVTRRALAIAERLGHRSGSVTCMLNISDFLMRAGRLDEALEWGNRAHAAASQLTQSRTYTYTTVTLAEIHLQLGNNDEARRYALEGLALAGELAAPEWAELATQVLEKVTICRP